MSDTMSEETRSIAFVRTEMLPEQAPPATAVGVVGWMRENLFSGAFNSILTVLSGAALFYIVTFMLGWIISPTWNTASLAECQQITAAGDGGGGGHFAGACWGVIRERWVQLLFGFYPSELYWRPLLAFVLLAVALAPVLFADKVPAKLIWFSALYPFIMPWLLWGGAFWIPLFVVLGLALGYFAFRLTAGLLGNLGGTIIAVIVPILWWLLLMPVATQTVEHVIGSARMEARAATLAEEIPVLQAREAELKARAKELEAQIDARIAAEKPALLEDKDGLVAFFADVVSERTELSTLQREIGNVTAKLGDKEGISRKIAQLPEIEEGQLPELEQNIATARSQLPDALADISSETELGAFKRAVEEGSATASEADIKTIETVLRSESLKANLESEVANTYSDAARIGLQPVESRKFGGFMLSIAIGVVAIAGSLPLGIVLALGRQSDLLIVKSLCVGFIEFIRGVPLITLLFVASTLLNIFLPPGTNFDIILRVLIMVTIFAAAYMAEVIRGGLAALPKGQYEGADSLGLDYWQAQRLIIMPQALKISIPGIVSTFIGVFKDTVLVSIIGLLDPLGLSNGIRADANWNGVVWELYGFIALLFFVFCFSMSRYSMYLERKLQTGHR